MRQFKSILLDSIAACMFQLNKITQEKCSIKQWSIDILQALKMRLLFGEMLVHIEKRKINLFSEIDQCSLL